MHLSHGEGCETLRAAPGSGGAPLSHPASDERCGEYPFAGFVVLPSNVDAAETAQLFARGLVPFATIFGPSGWGKTQLLENVACWMRRDGGTSRIRTVNALDWVKGLDRVEPHLPLILDNVQDALCSTRSKQKFLFCLERCVRSRRPTLLAFTEECARRNWPSVLPKPRTWMFARIGAPSGVEREVVVARIAFTEGVAISDVLRKLLATRLYGNGRTLLGAVKCLRLAGTHWLDHRSTLRACGLLQPLLSANPSWDLRDHVLAAARGLLNAPASKVRSSDAAVYVMLRVAQLCEADVAHFMRLAPSRAYAAAREVEKRCQLDEGVALLLDRLVARIVHGLMSN